MSRGTPKYPRESPKISSNTLISVTNPECRKAVELYAAELRRVGLTIVVEEVANDVELADEAGSQALRVEWADEEQSRPRSAVRRTDREEDWDDDDNPCDAGGAPRQRLAEHYLQTLEVLGRDPATAVALLRRMQGESESIRGNLRRFPRILSPRKSARGRTTAPAAPSPAGTTT